MASAILTWEANTESDLLGYRIYRAIGTSPLVVIASVGKVTTYTDATIPTIDGDVTYALTAFDTSGNESSKSVTVTKVVNTSPPSVPAGLMIVTISVVPK